MSIGKSLGEMIVPPGKDPVSASVTLEAPVFGNRANFPAPEHMPILIGITGKRDLTPTETESVRKRLESTFKRLDRDFPNASKVLLTGGAYGTDTIAAELLVHPGKDGEIQFANWSVVILLPFDQDLFEKDFRPKAGLDSAVAIAAGALAAKRLGRLRTLISKPDRVLVRTLPPLRGKPGGEIIGRGGLDKDSPQRDDGARHNHYEQVGQFIAEAATLLIAVMDGGEIANPREADGGTARVVAYRRAGRPDRHGIAVARNSAILRNDWGALVDPPAAYVWLIEPSRPASNGRYPVIVLAPADGLSEAYGNPAHVVGARPHGKHLLHASLAMLRASDWFQSATGRRVRRENFLLRLPGQLPARELIARLIGRLAVFGNRQPASPVISATHVRPTDAIGNLRAIVSSLQGGAKRSADLACQAIATLFLLAVLFLEIYADLPVSDTALLLYLIFLGAIFGAVRLIRLCRWQPISEDYRTVNEMLRIQRVWWSAGMADRVDHHPFQIADAELSHIRHAVRTVLTWIWLRSDWPTARPVGTDWEHVRGSKSKPRQTSDLKREKAPRDWIGGQIHYFATNYIKQKGIAVRLDAVAWLLFTASFCLAALLYVALQALALWPERGLIIQQALENTVASPLGRWMFADGFFLSTALALLLVQRRVRHGGADPRPQTRPDQGRGGNSGVWEAGSLAFWGGIIAVLCALAVQCGAIWCFGTDNVPRMEMVAKNLTLLVFVMLSATAGAIRYVLEKLNFAAQALAYRDILGRFERAEFLLAEGAVEASGVPGNEDEARTLIKGLALTALSENEAWLKAHRERPLNPP